MPNQLSIDLKKIDQMRLLIALSVFNCKLKMENKIREVSV